MRAQDALAFDRRLLLAHGLPETDAATVADAWSAPISALLSFSVRYAAQGMGRIQSMPAFAADKFEAAVKAAK